MLLDRDDNPGEEKDDEGGIAKDRGGPSIVIRMKQRQIEVSARGIKEGDEAHQFTRWVVADWFKDQLEERLQIMAFKGRDDRR